MQAYGKTCLALVYIIVFINKLFHTLYMYMKKLNLSSELNDRRVLVLHLEGNSLHKVVGRIVGFSENFVELETDNGVKHWISFSSIQKMKEVPTDDKK